MSYILIVKYVYKQPLKQIIIVKIVLIEEQCILFRKLFNSRRMYKNIIEVTGGRIVPEWIDVDQDNFKGTVKNLPTREMIDVPVNEMLIVELYSK